MHTTAEIREGFLSFFESKGHLRVPSASLVPRADDRSTLLTSAGMQPQMPFFLGREAPPALLTTTCQKVFRTPDIDEVGLDTYHLTLDRKSTRLNSSHMSISYAVFCLKKKKRCSSTSTS